MPGAAGVGSRHRVSEDHPLVRSHNEMVLKELANVGS